MSNSYFFTWSFSSSPMGEIYYTNENGSDFSDLIELLDEAGTYTASFSDTYDFIKMYWYEVYDYLIEIQESIIEEYRELKAVEDKQLMRVNEYLMQLIETNEEVPISADDYNDNMGKWEYIFINYNIGEHAFGYYNEISEIDAYGIKCILNNLLQLSE